MCIEGCPLPGTIPPVVTWVRPSPGGRVTVESELLVSATDDIQVTHVDFFYYGHRLLPATVAAPPYRIILGQYFHDWPVVGGPMTLTAIGWDVEGNADTANLVVDFSP